MASTTRSRSREDAFNISDDDFENGMLKDGHRIRVPLQMRDASSFDGQRTVLVDGTQHRPGYRTLVEDGSGSARDAAAHRHRLQLDEVSKARADYQDRLVNAWRGGDDVEPDDDDALPKGTPHLNAKPGQACALNGRPGVLRTGRDGQLYCFVGGNTNNSADSATDSRARMYELYDAKKAKEYLDPYPDLGREEDDDVDDMVEQTQSRPNRPNRSAPSSDSRTVAQAQKQHADRMSKIYAAEDVRLRDAWKE